MSTSQPDGLHSPLPWFAAEGEQNGNEYGVWGAISTLDGLFVVDVYADVEELSPAVAKANAELIVRAVNSHAVLVTALENAEAGLAAVCESGDWAMPDDTARELAAVLDDIRAALKIVDPSLASQE